MDGGGKKTEPLMIQMLLALATANKNNIPSVRMVLLKDFNKMDLFFIQI